MVGERKNIQVELPLEKGYGRQLFRGLCRAATEANLPWNLWVDTPGHLHASLSSNRFDGLFFVFPDVRTLQLIDDLKLKAVQMGPRPQPAGCTIPVVSTAEEAVGEMAALGLVELGFENFAFLHAERGEGAKRARAFAATITASGYQPHALARPTVDELGLAWEAGLKRPTAVFCLADSLAWKMAQACGAGGVDVPGDVSILGCDNDRLLCCHCTPPLSTVALATLELAREAVGIMREMFDGKELGGVERLVRPQGIIHRRSTRSISSDPEVSRAMTIIEERFDRPLQVEDVAREVGLSARTLQLRFRNAGSGTFHATLIRVRIQRAKEMLIDTNMTASEVAYRSGFSRPGYFFTQFRRRTGMTPSAFRERIRNDEHPD